MKIKFNEKATYLYDFCMFPKLLYVDPDELYKLNDVIGDEVMNTFTDHESHIEFVKNAKKDLEPYKDPLLGFYADEAISNYDFPSLLFRSYSFLNYDTYKDYLKMIMQDDEETIKTNLIYGLITVENNDDDISDAKARIDAEYLRDHREELLKLIRQTPTTENHRWILMLLIENPIDYLEVYIDLLEKIEPIFNKYYQEHAKKLDHFKDDVIASLQKGSVEAFESLTYNIVPSDVLEDTNIVITSIVNPYRFSIMSFGDDKTILWGLDMKAGFKKIAEFEQDSRKNRAKVFKTLSDETRYEVLRLLANGITSTKEIATSIGVSSATVTYHINAFLTAKVIKVVKSKKAKYVVDYERLENLWQDFLKDLKEQ